MILLLLACGPKIDPLQPLHQSLQAARQAGPTDDAPHMRFALSEAAVQGVVTKAINPERPFVVPVMLGTVAAIRIELDPPGLTTTLDPSCDCTRASLEARGRIDVDVAGLLGKQVLADDLGFSAALDGAPTFRLVPEADGLSVRLEPAAGIPWAVDLELDEEKGFLTNKLVDNQFEGPVSGFLARSVELAKLPPTVPLRPARIELVPGDAATLDIWIEGEASTSAPAIEVDEGWGLSLTDSGVLAVMRAAIAGQEQHPRWKIEPLAIEIRGDRFASRVRVHRVARKIQWRDYDVTGVVERDDESFRIVPQTVLEIGKLGWKGSLTGGFVTPTVRKQILKRQITLPTRFQTNDARYPTAWTIRDVDATDDGIFVRGSLELLDPPPAAPEAP